MKKKILKHIHDDPRIDCPACVEWIKSPLGHLPRLNVTPYPESPADRKRRKLMEKLIDYEFAQAKGSNMLKTPFGVLMWIPNSKKI